MYFEFAIKTTDMSVCHDNGKVTGKEMSNFFSCECDYYNIEKCRRSLNLILSFQQEKMMDFD